MPTRKVKQLISKKTIKKVHSVVFAKRSKRFNRLVWMLVVPALLYFIFFGFYTWPWMTHFNGWFFTDGGDGLQNVWNIWWVNKSVTELHQLPWHTMYLHVPFGVTLLGQTLNPFNGFVAIVLLKFLTLNQAFNVMVIFSFVFAGITAFWLSYYFTKSYLASLVGGFIFTFSSYHFAHAIGHLQLVSLQFIPLFILLWWKLLKKPTYWLATGSALTLMLIIMCDYYYFMYSVFTAIGIGVYLWRSNQLANFKARSNQLRLGLFGLLSLLLVAPLPIALFLHDSRDKFTGSHPTRLFSTDIITPFLDGGFWRFNSLTHFYWRHIKAYVAESSIYLGVSVIGLLTYSYARTYKKKVINKDVRFWQVLILVFGIFCLGPRLMVIGYSINHAPMPYALLEKIIPGLKLSGVPVRMMVMVSLGAAVVSAMVLANLNLNKPKSKLLVGLIFAMMFVELYPSTLPLTPVTQPKYVAALKSLPSGAVLDNAAISASYQLYHQTAFEKPMALGYISRTPQSLVDKEALMLPKISEGHYQELCSMYALRYITTPPQRPLVTEFPIVYQDNEAIIYDLKNDPGC